MKSNKPRVDVKTTRQIAQARSNIQVIAAELEEAHAKYNTIIARGCAFVGMPVTASLICLTCGLVYLRPPQAEGQQQPQNVPCPECTPKAKTTKSAAPQPTA